jgi:hypothetical protein
MRFPLEVVGIGKKNITGISHIKYVENIDLKVETNGLDGKFLKKRLFKKNDIENGLWM